MLHIGIMNTNDKKITINLQKLKELLWALLKYDLPQLSMTKNFISNNIDTWTDMISKEKEVEERFDKNSFNEALTTLFELNKHLNDLTEEVLQLAPSIQTSFEDVDMPLNNIQLATATLAYLNSGRCHR